MSCTAIEVIVRAIVTRYDGSLLVARQRGHNFAFLPGGHVKPGEPAERALTRELHEELGVDAQVGELVGAVEHMYTDSDQRHHHELNLVFAAKVASRHVTSHEDHLEFLWVPAADVAGYDLRPRPVRALVESMATVPRWKGARRPEEVSGA